MAGTRGWRPSTGVVVGLGAIVAASVAWVTRPVIAVDDAAITFRYAERLATGRGLSYNDGEHVLGASSGLHTLLLASGRWLGAPVTSTAVVLGVVGTAAATALVGLVAARLGGRLPAAVAMGLFIAGPVRWHAVGGLESATLLVCCLAAVAAWQAGWERLAGVALGLALVAKLDAGALLVSLVGASLLVRRRLPVAAMVWTAAAAAPWYLWVTWQFGNPLPQSLRSKVSGRADEIGYTYDPTWALRRMRAAVPAAVAGVAVALGRRDDDPGREVRLILVGWLVLGAAVVSLLPLGAPYPWYVAPLYGPLAILAGDAVGWARSVLRLGSRPVAFALVPLLLVGLSCVLGARNVVAEVGARGSGGGAARQWQDLRSAGRYLESHHRGEVVETCFGWPAFEAPSLTVADPCAINSAWPSGDVTVRVDVVDPGAPVDFGGWCAETQFDRAARAGSGQVVVIQTRC